MNPDEAVGLAAREAMEMLQRVQQEGTETNLVAVIAAVTQGLALVAQGLTLADALSDAERAHLLREARVSAAGALVVFALSPGVGDLPVPPLH